MSFRKRKGDAAEAVRQWFWEAQGALVFPLSPSFAGVDLIVFHPDGRIILSEVKGQRDPLYGETLREAIRKVRANVETLRAMDSATRFAQVVLSYREATVGWLIEGELVHVHLRREGRELVEDWTEVLWRDPE